MSLASRHDILNDISVLLPQGGNRGQDAGRKAGAVIALIAEASLPPQDRTAPDSLGPVVGRRNPCYPGKSAQCRPKLQEIGAGQAPKPGYKPELLEEVFPKSLEQSALVPPDL